MKERKLDLIIERKKTGRSSSFKSTAKERGRDGGVSDIVLRGAPLGWLALPYVYTIPRGCRRRRGPASPSAQVLYLLCMPSLPERTYRASVARRSIFLSLFIFISFFLCRPRSLSISLFVRMPACFLPAGVYVRVARAYAQQSAAISVLSSLLFFEARPR